MPAFDLLGVLAWFTNPDNLQTPVLCGLAIGALAITALVTYAVLKGWQPRPRHRETPPADLERLFAAIEALKRGENP